MFFLSYSYRRAWPLADPKGGVRDACSPRGSKFFHFHAVFGKNLKNNSNFGSWRTPWGKSWIRHWWPPTFHTSESATESTISAQTCFVSSALSYRLYSPKYKIFHKKKWWHKIRYTGVSLVTSSVTTNTRLQQGTATDDDVNADFSRWTFCTGRARHWLCALGSGVVNRKLRLPRFPLWWRQHSGGVLASCCSDLSPHWTASSPLATMEICLQFINFHRLWRHLKITPGSLSNAQKYRFILYKIKCKHINGCNSNKQKAKKTKTS